MAAGIDLSLANRVPNATLGKGGKNSCCISDCLSRIWRCIVRALDQFVNWLCCHSSKKDKPQNANRSLNPEKPPIRSEKLSTEVLLQQPTNDKPEVASVPQTQGNITVAEFVECAKNKATTADVQEFVKRGGILHLAIQEKPPIVILENEQVITACHAGINRSQVAAAVLSNMGVKVIGVLSGELMTGKVVSNSMGIGITSLFTKSPDKYDRFFPEQFYQVFGRKKLDQIGRDYAVSFPIDETGDDISKIAAEQFRRREKIGEFFQQYINGLGPTHFVTFCEGLPEVLKCLLKRPGSLENFTITYSPMMDTILLARGADGYAQAYGAFGDKLKSSFTVAKAS